MKALAALLLITAAVHATNIEIDIPQIFEGRVSSFDYNASSNLVRFVSEFQNTGSVPYAARMRLDIDNGSFISWTDERVLLPGDRFGQVLYWYNNESGVYKARLRVYYGGEVADRETIVAIRHDARHDDAFNISDVRVFHDYVQFAVNGHAIAMPYDFPRGWTFGQAAGSGVIRMRYSSQEPADVWIGLASPDGRAFSMRKLHVERRLDAAYVINYLAFRLFNIA